MTGSWKTCLLGTSKLFEKTQLKILMVFILHIWIKQLLNLLRLKFHTKSFFFLGDMYDYMTDQLTPPLNSYTTILLVQTLSIIQTQG